MRFQQQLTQITGTVGINGTVAVSGTVNTQSQQRLLGSFTPSGASGSFTITGLLPSDQFLWFVFDPSQAGTDPVWLLITGVTNTNQTYGSIAVTIQTPDFVPCLPLVENQVRVAYTTLLSLTNPIGLKVYASPVAPTRIPKLVTGSDFQGAMTAAQVVQILNTAAVARLKGVNMTLTVTGATGAGQVHFDYRDVANIVHHFYLDIGLEPATQSSTSEIFIPLYDAIAAGVSGGNAASFVADNGNTLATCSLLYEDLRGK